MIDPKAPAKPKATGAPTKDETQKEKSKDSAKPEKTVTPEPKNPEEDKDKPESVPPEDVQLLKAVEMLKSWKVFKQLRPAA